MFRLAEEVIDDPTAVDVKYQTPEELKIDNANKVIVHDDDNNIEDFEKPMHIEDYDDSHQGSTAISDMKSDPTNINIAHKGDEYYVDHNDLRQYMDLNGETYYESALNDIIRAHYESGITADNIRVVLNQNDYYSLDNKIKSIMEASIVRFEVYPD